MLKTVAYMETWVIKILKMLKEKLVATQNQVRKKQSSSYEEILADQMQNNKIFAMQDEPAVEEKK